MAASSSSPVGETVLFSATREAFSAASVVGEGTEVAEGELSGLVVRPVVKIGSPSPRDRL